MYPDRCLHRMARATAALTCSFGQPLILIGLKESNRLPLALVASRLRGGSAAPGRRRKEAWPWLECLWARLHSVVPIDTLKLGFSSWGSSRLRTRLSTESALPDRPSDSQFPVGLFFGTSDLSGGPAEDAAAKAGGRVTATARLKVMP